MNWVEFIFSDRIAFEEKASQIFEYQYENNSVYKRFCEALPHPSDRLKRSDGFEFPPLLPIKAFKDAEITCSPAKEPELLFRSSGTSRMQRSRHLVTDEEIYLQSIIRGFRYFYNLDNAVIWAYTPGYSDNPESSLVWMLKALIERDESGLSRFLPLNKPLNENEINEIIQAKKQLILFGAAFGLLDLLENKALTLPSNSIVIETGGMKTHRREISREELHQRLANGLNLEENRIHSEYGMCELLSQAYATGGQWFRPVPWMRVSIHNPENPLEELPPSNQGLIGIIDLANVHSCSFLLTGDKGLMNKNGRFKVLGRWYPKDLRGCNFLIEED